MVFYLSGTTTSITEIVAGTWWNAVTGGAVTGIQVAFNSGNVSTGSVKIYGLL